MSKTGIGLHDAVVFGDQHTPTADEIRRQLRMVLASPAFHGSRRCQQFLEYVCEKSLAGQGGMLKERIIAIDVFGRQPQTDLGEDTIVRVGAREVRKRLAQYNVTPEGTASEVRIDLPSGAYAPEFHYVTAAPAPAPIKEVAQPAARPVKHTRRWRLILFWGFLAFAAFAIVAITKVTASNPNTEAFRRFWEPVFRAPDPLLVAVANPIVYHPSRRALNMASQTDPPQQAPPQQAQWPLHFPVKGLDGSDMVPVLNQYVGFGDMVAANEVTSMLARKSKGVRLRLASSVEFADLRKAPTLLIGAVTNRWTMELQQAWRFRFSLRPDFKLMILDTKNPAVAESTRLWSIPSKEDGSAPEDYILICRVRNSLTGGLTLVVAGLKQFGTEAAGRLLADSDQLGAILSKLPTGWESKNVQFVLHARVIGNTPA